MSSSGPPPRWTRQAPDVRRKQILDGASEVILRTGYDAMTMSDVAATAGVGKGTVYNYFDSKLDLLLGLQDRYWAGMFETMRSVADADDVGWAERADRLVDDLVNYIVDQSSTFHALFHETPVTRGEPLQDMTALLVDLLDQGSAADAYRVEDTRVTAAFLVDGLHGVGRRAVHASPENRAREVAAVQTLVRRMLGL